MLRFSSILFLVFAALLAACSPTKQARSVETSGFLGTIYPLMHKGEDGEALLLYKNPKVATIPRGTYKKMLLDHVQVWGPPTTDPDRQARAQKIADLLYTLAYDSMSQDYEMASEPGPGTLHAQVAITRADPAYVVLRAVSTVPAPMNAFAVASMLKNIGTGKPLFVGDASLELKLSDSQTGEVLGASADRRVGKKRLDADSFDSWDDVHKALAYWVKKARYRLCQERQAQNCASPD
ncbi:MAG: putative Lipoprotein [Nitrospira sp.]